MKKNVQILLILLIVSFFSPLALAGPYPPAAGQSGSTAISMNDSSLGAWATGWVNYAPGSDLDDKWKTPGNALGKANGNSFDVVCLGRGGSITLTFDAPISNGDGWDFAIFENSFSDYFLELAYVEVSANGTNFVRFINRSLTSGPVSTYGELDPTDVDGLAGKYRQGYGTPFDLADVGLSSATHVRIVDIIGDGSYFDSIGHVIYDPCPTSGSAGFDLDAVGVITHVTKPSDPPTVTTSSAGSISTSSATLDGTVNPNGSSTSYYFEYGPTSAYGFKTGSQDAGQGNSAVSVNAQLTGLDENATYHFRISAQNQAGVTYGIDKTFHTTAHQDPLSAPTLSLIVSENKVDLQWPSVSDATGYYLCVTDPQSKWTALWDWGIRTSVHATLQGGSSYYVSVIPYNTEGTGDASNVVHVKTASD